MGGKEFFKKNFKNMYLIILFIHMCMLMWVYVNHMHAGPWISQKASHPLNLQLQSTGAAIPARVVPPQEELSVLPCWLLFSVLKTDLKMIFSKTAKMMAQWVNAYAMWAWRSGFGSQNSCISRETRLHKVGLWALRPSLWYFTTAIITHIHTNKFL